MRGLGWVRAVRALRSSLVAPVSVQTITAHVGQITSTSPLQLNLDGNTTVAVPAVALDHYTPTVADFVRVLNVNGVLEVVGKLPI